MPAKNKKGAGVAWVIGALGLGAIALGHGPEAADDEEVVEELHRTVTRAAQRLIDEGLRARSSADESGVLDRRTTPDAEPGIVERRRSG